MTDLCSRSVGVIGVCIREAGHDGWCFAPSPQYRFAASVKRRPKPHRHFIVRSERVVGRLPNGEELVEESFDCPCGRDMTHEALG